MANCVCGGEIDYDLYNMMMDGTPVDMSEWNAAAAEEGL